MNGHYIGINAVYSRRIYDETSSFKTFGVKIRTFRRKNVSETITLIIFYNFHNQCYDTVWPFKSLKIKTFCNFSCKLNFIDLFFAKYYRKRTGDKCHGFSRLRIRFCNCNTVEDIHNLHFMCIRSNDIFWVFFDSGQKRKSISLKYSTRFLRGSRLAWATKPVGDPESRAIIEWDHNTKYLRERSALYI